MNCKILLFALLCNSLFANSGKQTYDTLCSACHGLDGKGNTDAGIPPVQRSEWLLGNPRRAINIILHGVHGPMTVAGKEYNSMMPGQGAMLNDQQIADVVNYIRVNFKNKEKFKVKPEMVAKERAQFAKQVMPWETAEILKIYPLVSQRFGLSLKTVEVSYNGGKPTVYQGEEILPDQIDTGFKKDLKKGYRTVTYKGDAEAFINGNYTFHLLSDYGVKIKVDEKTVMDRPDGSPIDRSQDSIRLKKGTYPFECVIIEREGFSLLKLEWAASGSNKRFSLMKQVKGNAWATIELKPTEELLVYRNYIAGMHSSRSIAVALPTGVNFAFDAQTMGPGIYWKDQFINAGRHWTARGGGLESPMGKNVISSKHDLLWGEVPPEELQFNGYQISPDRKAIVFRYTVNGDQVEDLFESESENSLVRTTTLKKGKPKSMIIYEGEGAMSGKKIRIAEKAMLETTSPVKSKGVGEKTQLTTTIKAGKPVVTKITFN